jgi:hypothetical protein
MPVGTSEFGIRLAQLLAQAFLAGAFQLNALELCCEPLLLLPCQLHLQLLALFLEGDGFSVKAMTWCAQEISGNLALHRHLPLVCACPFPSPFLPLAITLASPFGPSKATTYRLELKGHFLFLLHLTHNTEATLGLDTLIAELIGAEHGVGLKGAQLRVAFKVLLACFVPLALGQGLGEARRVLHRTKAHGRADESQLLQYQAAPAHIPCRQCRRRRRRWNKKYQGRAENTKPVAKGR